MSGAAVVRGGLISVAAIGLAACGAATTTTPPVQPASPAASSSAKASLSGTLAEAWHELPTANNPLARNSAGFAFDVATQNVVLSGGRHGCGANATSYTDTWTLNGTTWHLQPKGISPGDMASASMAYDPDISKVVALGVYSGCGVATGMLTWSGSAWTSSPQSMTLPSPMFWRSLAYDGATHQLIAFGFGEHGIASGAYHPTGAPETWAYDGTRWTQLHPAQSPPGLTKTSMAYDSLTHQVVLFGGDPYNIDGEHGAPTNSTWVFDGTTWTQLAPPTAPAARVGASMVFDQALGRIVLFGGASTNPDATSASPAVFDDTWSFDGTTWQQLHPTTVPSGRFLAQMTYDSATQQIVLFGGALNTTSDANDTWTFGVH